MKKSELTKLKSIIRDGIIHNEYDYAIDKYSVILFRFPLNSIELDSAASESIKNYDFKKMYEWISGYTSKEIEVDIEKVKTNYKIAKSELTSKIDKTANHDTGRTIISYEDEFAYFDSKYVIDVAHILGNEITYEIYVDTNSKPFGKHKSKSLKMTSKTGEAFIMPFIPKE